MMHLSPDPVLRVPGLYPSPGISPIGEAVVPVFTAFV